MLWQHVVLCKSYAAENAPDYSQCFLKKCDFSKEKCSSLKMVLGLKLVWGDFKYFNVKILCMCISWCADQMTVWYVSFRFKIFSFGFSKSLGERGPMPTLYLYIDRFFLNFV